MNLDPKSVRGVIRAFLERNAHLLADPILEVGSRCHGTFAERPWMNNRTLRPDCEFVGIDLQPGEGVDVVVPPEDLWGALGHDEFGSAILSEVLEHDEYPHDTLTKLNYALVPNSCVLITVPFAHHVHGFPHDFWRFTPDGLRHMLETNDFEVLEIQELAHVRLTYSDHGEPAQTFTAPRQLGCVARRA